MPYFTTAQEFMQQAELLLAAYPKSTRLSTKYKVPHPNPPPSKYRSSSQSPKRQFKETTTKRPRNIQAYLVLKAFEPHLGICLKYKTDKAAEVGRLVAALGRCGRAMADLPQEPAEMEVDLETHEPPMEVKPKKKKKGKK